MASPSSPGFASSRSLGPARRLPASSGVGGGTSPDARDSPSPGPTTTTTSIPHTLWSLEVPLHITHPSDSSRPPFVVSVPRFSYLALLLPRLTAYFGTACSSFHHEEVQLRNLPIGLLVDLYQPAALPWRLVVGDGPEWDIGDTFLNGAKEADFVRNNNAQQIMSLSKADTTALWNAVQDSKYFGSISGSGWSIQGRFPLPAPLGPSQVVLGCSGRSDQGDMREFPPVTVIGTSQTSIPAVVGNLGPSIDT